MSFCPTTLYRTVLTLWTKTDPPKEELLQRVCDVIAPGPVHIEHQTHLENDMRAFPETTVFGRMLLRERAKEAAPEAAVVPWPAAGESGRILPQAGIAPLLVIRVPQFFQDPEFIAWINQPRATLRSNHRPGQPPTDDTEVIVTVYRELDGDGDATEMPRHCWAQIINTVRAHFRPYQQVDDIEVMLLNQPLDADTED